MLRLKAHNIIEMKRSSTPAISAYFDFSGTRAENYIHIERLIEEAKKKYSNSPLSTLSSMTNQLTDRIFGSRSFLDRPRAIAYFCTTLFEGYFPLRDLLWEGVVYQDGFYLTPIRQMMNKVESFQVVVINSKRALIYQSCNGELHKTAYFQIKQANEALTSERIQINDDIVNHSTDDYFLPYQQLCQFHSATDRMYYSRMMSDVQSACRVFSGFTILVGNPRYTLEFFKQSQLNLPNLLLVTDCEMEYQPKDKLYLDCLEILSSHITHSKSTRVAPVLDAESFRTIAS